jgi:hypothetical protein
MYPTLRRFAKGCNTLSELHGGATSSAKAKFMHARKWGKSAEETAESRVKE